MDCIERGNRVWEILERCFAEDEVEGRVWKWHASYVALAEVDVHARVSGVGGGDTHERVADVQAGDGVVAQSGKLDGGIAGARGDLQHGRDRRGHVPRLRRTPRIELGGNGLRV